MVEDVRIDHDLCWTAFYIREMQFKFATTVSCGTKATSGGKTA